VTLRFRVGDAARAAIFLAAADAAVTDGPRAAIAIVLLLPPALALRALPVHRWLDTALCTALLGAQLGSQAGLTESTVWWDGAAHMVVGALLGLAVARSGPWRSYASTVVAVAALAIGWEIAESASDAAFGTDFVPGVGDTLSDLALGLLGAAVAAGALLWPFDFLRMDARGPAGAQVDRDFNATRQEPDVRPGA
jgi:hypothetical protein